MTAATLRTARFVLRPIVESDRERLAFLGDEEFRRHLRPGLPDPPTFVANNRADEAGLNLVIDRDGEVVGTVHLGLGSPAYVGELACLIKPSWWGRGVAVEACLGVLDHAFRHTPLRKAFARCEATHERSARVLRKLGFVQEAELRRHRLGRGGQLLDERWFGLLREEWATLAAR